MISLGIEKQFSETEKKNGMEITTDVRKKKEEACSELIGRKEEKKNRWRWNITHVPHKWQVIVVNSSFDIVITKQFFERQLEFSLLPLKILIIALFAKRCIHRRRREKMKKNEKKNWNKCIYVKSTRISNECRTFSTFITWSYQSISHLKFKSAYSITVTYLIY